MNFNYNRKLVVLLNYPINNQSKICWSVNNNNFFNGDLFYHCLNHKYRLTAFRATRQANQPKEKLLFIQSNDMAIVYCISKVIEIHHFDQIITKSIWRVHSMEISSNGKHRFDVIELDGDGNGCNHRWFWFVFISFILFHISFYFQNKTKV